jgi:hypothetical protein
MKTKRVLRYYCDYCHKGRCHKASAIKHEKHCIRNPNRECGFCEAMDEKPKPFQELNDVWGSKGFDAVRDAAHNCPACILAVIVQSRATEYGDCDEKAMQFRYKEEVAEFWKKHGDRSGNQWVKSEPMEAMIDFVP